MKRTVLLVGVLALLGSASSAAAQQQAVSATVTMRAQPAAVQVGDVVVLEVQARVTGSTNPQVDLPDLSGFDVLSRQVSTPMQFRFGFGNQAQVVQSTTTYQLTLRARQPGTFALPPATVLIDGRRFQSNGVTIQVGGAADPGLGQQLPSQQPPSQQPPSQQPPSQQPPPSTDGTMYDPNAFVRTVVDQSQPYVGQQVTATVYLYTRQPLGGGLSITQEPSTEGFWVHDLLPPTRTLEAQQQRVQDTIFHVYVLRRFAAFPLRAGTLTIGGTGVSASSGGIFDIFAPSTPLNRVGPPVTLEARELPAGGPAGEPHVGSLELSASLDPTQVATGDAVQLTVTARGVGMLRQLRLPDPAAPGLRVLAPEISDQIGSPRDLVGGTRTFRWLVVPEREGTYTLGPFTVPVLDPRTGTYSVARADGIRLTAAGNPIGGAEPEPDRAATRRAAEGTLTLGPIRTRSALARSHAPLASGAWVPLAFALGPVLLLAALGVWAARRRGARSPVRGAKQASRDARRRLSAAGDHARRGEPREFYAAVALALKEVLEAKLARPVGSLTHGEVRRVVVERGMPEALADRVVDELEGCDFARFSAAGVHGEEMQGCLERTRALLDELDRFAPRAEVEA